MKKICQMLLFIGIFSRTGLWARNEMTLFDRKRPCPDVILIAVDTLRADHLGCYGYSRSTSPNIDAFAREGTLFEECYSPASWTLPALMSVFTGVLPGVHGVDRIEEVIPLSDAVPTLAEMFREAGYFCGAVVCNYYARGAYGFYRGFDIYDEYSVYLDTFTSGYDPALYANHNAIYVRTGWSITENAVRLLEKGRATGKPVFLFVLFYDPHDDYVPSYPFYREYGVDYNTVKIGRGLKDRRHAIPEGPDLANLINLYDGEVAYDDQCFGELLRRIDSMGRREDTLIIFFSDHGEAFGEHGALLHGNSLHREEVHVPMIWRWPGVVAAGHRVHSPVSALDIPATLGELFSFKKGRFFQGRSLWPALLGKPLQERPVFAERGSAVAVTFGRYRWFYTGTEHSLFDRKEDRREQKNLFSSADEETLLRFEEFYRQSRKQTNRLLAELRAGGVRESKPVELSEEEKRQLKSLGYIQ